MGRLRLNLLTSRYFNKVVLSDRPAQEPNLSHFDSLTLENTETSTADFDCMPPSSPLGISRDRAGRRRPQGYVRCFPNPPNPPVTRSRLGAHAWALYVLGHIVRNTTQYCARGPAARGYLCSTDLSIPVGTRYGRRVANACSHEISLT